MPLFPTWLFDDLRAHLVKERLRADHQTGHPHPFAVTEMSVYPTARPHEARDVVVNPLPAVLDLVS